MHIRWDRITLLLVDALLWVGIFHVVHLLERI